MSFDDLFWKRDFSSFIQKESNVYDRAVSPNWDGLDALLQSEKVRNEIFTFEHDLWHFEKPNNFIILSPLIRAFFICLI